MTEGMAKVLGFYGPCRIDHRTRYQGQHGLGQISATRRDVERRRQAPLMVEDRRDSATHAYIAAVKMLVTVDG